LKYIVAAVTVGAWVGIGTTLSAQPQPAAHSKLRLTAGGGGAELWDDETRLGSGPLVTGGVVAGHGDHMLVSGSLDWSQHKRSLTYLATDGHVASGFARLTYVFGSSDRARPIVGAGLGVLRSTGTLKTPSISMSGPTLTPPVLGVETPWAVTRPAWDIHGGVRAGLAPRLVLQPEVRWRSTFGSAGNASGIEPPLLGVQALVSFEWRIN